MKIRIRRKNLLAMSKEFGTTLLDGHGNYLLLMRIDKVLYKRFYKGTLVMGFEALQGANEVHPGYPIKGDFYEEVDLNELLAIRQIDTIGDPEILKYVKVWLKNLNKFRFGPLRTILVLLLWATMFIMLNFRETKEYALCFLLPVSILFTCFWLFVLFKLV